MADFTGKAAIVTGAGGAIGSATARMLTMRGAAVALLDLSTSQAERVATDITASGGRAIFIPCDVSREADVHTAVERTAGALGLPSLLVTVAAINITGRIEDLRVEDWDQMMAVNVRGVFLPIKHTVPHMKRLGAGAIVNLSSVSAFIGANNGSPYHTTKGAVLSMSRALAQELAPHHIRVNAVCPGWVDTPFTDAYIEAQADPKGLRAQVHGMHALGRMATPEEVAEAVCWLLSERAGFSTGTELFVDGGFMIKR